MTETTIRAERRTDMAFGATWLLFLASPIAALVLSDAPSPWRITGAVATGLFSIAYLASFLYPTPWGVGNGAGIVVWTLALAILVALTLPAIGAYALAFLPFLVALSVFRLDPPWDVVAALVPAVITIASLLLFSESGDLFWPISIALVPLVIMLPIRRVSDAWSRQARLREELALSQQREQVGRDVHDILGHSLTVIAVKTELAGKLLQRDPERAQAELDDVLELARSSLNEVRATVTQLQSPQLDAQLTSATIALRSAGISVVSPARLPDVTDARSHLLAWCLREAVTNVVRHSDASHCRIDVSPATLTVTDDGLGRRDSPEGNGLRGMRQRVADAGGTLTVTEAEPLASRSGTRVEVRL